MSSFEKLFGGGSKSRNTTTGNSQHATEKLRELEDIHQKKVEYLENKIAGEVTFAKENCVRNRPAAMAALKRKKRHEEQLKQAEGTLINIQTQREMLDNPSLETFRVLNQSSQVLKKEHKNLDVDKVHETLDNFQDQQDLTKEIGEAISTPVMDPTPVDDDDLLAELAGLQQEKLEEQFEKVHLPNLPAVPDSVPAGAVASGSSKALSDEERELEELEAMMAS